MQKKIIIYDFDGTLTPYPVTKFKILDVCGYEGGVDNPKLVEAFNKRLENDNLYGAIYRTFIEKVNETSYNMTNDNICMGAEDLEFNKGVFEYFDWLKDLNVSNYVLSSGLKEMISRTKVSKFFDCIYGTTFMYDEDGIAYDVDSLIDDEAKAIYIEKIINDNGMKDCSDVIYIGDGLTDYYAMEFVKKNGGISIFVYNDEDSDDLVKAKESGVVSYFFKADYSDDSELSNFIKSWCKN